MFSGCSLSNRNLGYTLQEFKVSHFCQILALDLVLVSMLFWRVENAWKQHWNENPAPRVETLWELFVVVVGYLTSGNAISSSHERECDFISRKAYLLRGSMKVTTFSHSLQTQTERMEPAKWTKSLNLYDNIVCAFFFDVMNFCILFVCFRILMKIREWPTQFQCRSGAKQDEIESQEKKHVAAKKICAHSCCHLWCECFLICDSAHIKISYRLSGLFSAATEYYVCTKSYKWMSRQFWNDENNEIYQQIFEYVYRLALCSLAAIQIRIPFDLFRLFGSNIQNRWYLNT